MPNEITFRDIEDVAEMREVEQLQKEIWGVADREIFPALALIPVIEVGGVLIGAFDDDRMIGFVFGFPGYEPPKPSLPEPGHQNHLIMHSDMLAVRPEYRSHSLGYKLKLAQRDRTLAKGIDTISWTFDPLQSLNAHLNISKLGVTSDSYRVNYYGETSSFLHRGGTDRLWVTWDLNSQRVKERITGSRGTEAPAETRALVRVGENNEPIRRTGELNDRLVTIEIPASINALDIELAVRWREATRAAFLKAMAAGLVVKEFYRLERDGRNTGTYLLSR
jgi:predicted GNAT superfamily acetyltransferase